MDAADLSRYPHLSWMRFDLAGSPGGASRVLAMESVCHTVCCTFRGSQDIRQVTRGRETAWHEARGTVNLLPADGESHTFITTMTPDLATVVFLVPVSHVRAFLDDDGCASRSGMARRCTRDDPVLRRCMSRLAAAGRDDAGTACAADEAARRLVLRLAELSGGGLPDWHDDASVFDRATLGHLVAHIDGHLGVPPCIGDLAPLVGLCPSHFAVKFRRSTGLSLQRFVNRRRIRRSLEALRDHAQPLSRVAFGLGFSSQAHFTRLFHAFTGMTPAKYRGLHSRTVG